MRALATYRELLANRNLVKLLGGEFVSAIGDWLYIVALLVVIYRETGDPLVLGLFGAARILPYILLSIPAGYLADRVDRRMILLVTDLARGACMAGMAVVIATDGPVWVLVALSILAACFSTFFYPAIGAYIPNLARDERQLGPANSAWASLDNLGFVVGPILGGLLLAAGGFVLPFVINGVTFMVIAAILWTLPPSKNVVPPTSEAAPGQDGTSDAPATVEPAAHSPLRPLLGIATFRFIDYCIFGGIGMLTVIIATDVLGMGEAGTGFLNAAVGIGGVLGAVVAGLLVLRRRLTVPIVLGSIAIAAGAVVLGSANALVVAMLGIALACLGHLVLEVMAATILQRSTADAIRGRAVGAMVTVDTIGEATGSLVFPVAVAAFGTVAALGVGAGLMILATVVALVLMGGAVDRPERPFEATFARVVRSPLFAGASSAAIEAALERFEVRDVVAGETVILQGDPADHFYVIESGTFDVRQTAADGTSRELRHLGPDDVFGELGLLSGAPRSASVIAESDGRLLVLDGPDFLSLVGSRTPLRGRLLTLYEPAPEPGR